MGVDRILQLKLVADVGEINQKMGQAADATEGGVGRMKGAFSQLKSFAVPIMADIALQGVTMVADAFKAQLEHAAHLRDAFHQLEAVSKGLTFSDAQLKIDTSSMDKAEAQIARLDATDLKLGIDTSGMSTAERKLAQIEAKQKGLRGVADELRDIGVSVGVGEDAKIVSALSEIVTMTGKLKLSRSAVEAIFDAMRGLNVDFDTAKGMVINGIILGRSRQMDTLGISGDTAAERLKSFNEKFGTAAEDFAKTSDGKWAVATAQWDGHMLNLAILVDQAMLDLKGSLVTAWNNLSTIIGQLEKIWDAIAGKWGPVLDDAIEVVQDAYDDLKPIFEPLKKLLDLLILAPFRAMKRILGSIWKGITGNFEGFRDDLVGMVRDLANTVIDLLNDLSGAFAFSAKFDIPSITVPDIGDPVGALVDGKTITIGGGSVDLSRGRLFKKIPRLAAGGVVTGPTLALLGEGAHDEAVVPLDGRRMGNSYTINVSAPASAPADVGRVVVEAIEAFERRAGASWRK